MTISSAILYFLMVIISLSLFFGFVVLVTNEGWKKQINSRFFIFAVSASLWQLINLLMLVSKTETWALLWTRMTFVTGIIGAYLLLRFIIVFPRTLTKSVRVLRLIDISSFIITVLVAFLSLTANLVKSVYWSNGVLLANYGGSYIIYDVAVIIIFLIIFASAFINFRKANLSEKSQVRFMLLGIGLTLIFIIFTDLLSPLIFRNDYLSNFGAYSMVFLFGFTAYGIVKHELFDIRVILTETASAIVILALLAQLIFAQTTTERIVNFVLLIVVTYGGYFLIKSVKQEIKRRKQLQTLSTQLAHANEHLKELDRMKTEFVSLASHELLTPVSAIEGYLSMLLDEKLAKVDDPKAVQYMDRVYGSAKRLARLVTDMLNVSRIEEDRLLVEKKEINLSELIRQVADELKFKAEEKKQKVEFSGDHWETFGDPDKIKEILVNLIGNSIKYSKNPGTITVAVETVPTTKVQEIWQKIEEEIKAGPLDDQEAIKSATDERLRQLVGENQILIHVKDKGIGIPKEELPRLFKKFHRVGDYTTAESQGTGLGLYISRALVELHHGRVWADSDGSGKGSTFTFSLPELSQKQEIAALEAQVPQKKEQLRPLAQPPKEAEEL